MSNVIIPSNFGQLAPIFAGTQPAHDELSAGIASSYGIMGYRGKIWRIKYRGAETDLMRADGDGPRASIEVVIVAAASNLAKIFYKNGYVEGSTEAPDCFSNNGQTPDPGSKEKQANTCAGCPMNAWGSRVTPAGKQGKACSDSKRVVVVPLGDIANEMYGGPMLLRIPAASLGDLAAYSQKMSAQGFPFYAIGSQISFDTKEAYPRFVYKAIRPLSVPEGREILALRDDPRVQRILNEQEDMSGALDNLQPVAEPLFLDPNPNAQATGQAQLPPHDPQTGEVLQQAAPAPAAAPAPVQQAAPAQRRTYKKTPAPAPAPAPAAPVQAAPVQAAPVQTAPAPEAASTGATSFDDALDAELDKLL